MKRHFNLDIKLLNELKAPSIWLRVKAEVQPHVTGVRSYGIWLYIVQDYGISYRLSDFISSSLTYFPISLSLTLSTSATLSLRCGLNSPVILLQSHYTCFSLLEMLFPQTSLWTTALSFKSYSRDSVWNVTPLSTDVSNPSHLIIFLLGIIMQLIIYYLL